MSTLLIPHRPTIRRHSAVPFLWRIVCPACKWTAYAATEARALAAANSHTEAEEPFPFDMTPFDPTHGRQD